MSTAIPPPPIRDPWGSYQWEEWFRLIRQRATESLTTILWSGIDFTGSNITSILTRRHNDLQNQQGGSSAEYYHLTSNEYTELQRDNNVTTVSVNTTLDDSYNTVVVDTTAKTITLPAASTARIGKTWTIILGTTGYTDITRAGSDTFVIPTADTTIQLNIKGSSLTLKCLTATSWGIV